MPQLTPLELLQLTQGAPAANPELPVEPGLDYAGMLGYGAPTQPMQPQNPIQAPIEHAQAPGSSISAGRSYQAFNPATFEHIQRGPGSRLDKKIATDRAQVEQEFDPTRQAIDEATQLGMQAQDRASAIEGQKLAATAQGKLRLSQANQNFMAQEQAASDNAKAESQANIQQYRAAVMEAAAAKVDPRQLWEHAGTAGQIGMLVTAFAHDFLGAKGIKTSGMDSIKQAIQNNIDSQVENMRHKREVSQGFKSLWDMQRAQSASDSEARARMQGFYLSALSNAIEGELGQYDSQLAQAKGQAAKAELLKEQVKNDLQVQRYIDEAAHQRAQERIDVYRADLSASIQREQIDATLKAAQAKAQADKLLDRQGRLISDPSLSGGNRVVREFLPGTPGEVMAKKREQSANVLHTVGLIERLVELQDQADRTPPTDLSAVKKLQNEKTRVAEMVRNMVKMGIIYDNSGKQINEQEMKLYEEIVGKKDWWLNGDNVRQFGELAGNLRAKNDMVMNAISTEIGPGDPFYGTTFGKTEFDPANKTLTDLQRAPGAGKPTTDEAERYEKWSKAPNASEAFPVDDLPEKGPGAKASVQHNWDKFKKDNPWALTGERQDTDRRARGSKDPIDVVVADNPSNPDRAFVQLERLADLAMQGDAKAKKIISEMANSPATVSTTPDGLLKAYAQWELATKLQGK